MKNYFSFCAALVTASSFNVQANTAPDYGNPFNADNQIACPGPNFHYEVSSEQKQELKNTTVALLMEPKGSEVNALNNVTALSDVFTDLEKKGYNLPLIFKNSESGVMTITGRTDALTGQALYDVLKKHGSTSMLINQSAVTVVGAPVPLSLEVATEGKQKSVQLNSVISTFIETDGLKAVNYFMCASVNGMTSSGNSRLMLYPATAILEVHNTNQGILFLLTTIKSL